GGTVEGSPGTLTVGYVAQEPDARPGETLLDYLARRTGVADAERDFEFLTAEMAEDPELVDAYIEALDRFLALGGEDLPNRAAEYAGAWTEYVERRALARSQHAEAHRKYVEERDRLRGRAREQRQWGTVGAEKVKKRQPDNDKAQRDWKVNRTERLASKVKATERRLEQLERNAVDKPWEGWQLHLSLNPKNRSGDVVARLEEA